MSLRSRNGAPLWIQHKFETHCAEGGAEIAIGLHPFREALVLVQPNGVDDHLETVILSPNQVAELLAYARKHFPQQSH